MATHAIPINHPISVTARRMQNLLERQRQAFVSEGPPTRQLRIQRLDRLIASLLEHQEALVESLADDFGHRSRDWTRMDIALQIQTAKYCKKQLKSWMKPERRRVMFPFNLLGATAEVRYQPLGVVGIVSAWNSPVWGAFGPLFQVLAAGNRALLKPSEHAPATADVIANVVQHAFDENEVAVITGDVDVARAFVELPLDHLMFTGSGAVGKQVMRAAAENLVPVTLELGGKCPVIVGKDADLKDVAIKVMAGKCGNGGQLCVAPDYLFVPEHRRDELVEALKMATETLFDGLRDNPDYTSIVNDRHRMRLQGYLTDAQQKGAKLVELNPKGESFDPRRTRKLPPTLVLDPTYDMAVLKEEIFGPLLPIQTYGMIGEVIDYINQHDRPLALYYFGRDAAERERVLAHTTSGGVTVNDVIMHSGQDDLPLGGVGPSGTGAFHGKEGFRTFSHARAIYSQAKFDFLGKLLRPPYGKGHHKLVEGMLKP